MPLGLSCERDLPAIGGKRMRDGATDVAGAAENEGAPRDRSLDDHDRVADLDLAVGEDVRVQPAAVHESLDYSRLRHRLEVRAGLAELDPFAFDVTDAETLADELVDVDAAREDVAPGCSRFDRHVAVLRNRSHRFGRDQRDRASRGCVAFGPVVTVALETAPGVSADALDWSR